MSTTATAVPTGTWNIDPAHSRVGFSVKHLGISTVRGEFANYDGSLVVGEDGSITASGTVAVDSIDTRQPDRDGHLKSADFFDAANYPEITFRSTSVVATDEDTYEITGDLTLRGVTQQITLTAEIGGGETDGYGFERIGLEATGTISRSAYGMKFNQALGSGNAIVSDKVKLDLDISAVKAA
jgi:polyisoprenoid-binding protein YceI